VHHVRLGIAIGLATTGFALLVLGAFAAPDAESAPRAEADAARRGGTLRVDLSGDFDYVDPALAYGLPSWNLGNAIHLKLLALPDKDGPAGKRIVPQAAARLPFVSRDGKTYTFAIRRGFRFSDGRPVTAHNFIRAFERALSPRMQSPAATFVADVRRYRALGPYTLRVTLKRLAPDFLARMTLPFFAAVPRETPLDANGVRAPLASAGPYYLREWTPARSALAVRNPYWNNGRAPWKALGRPAHVDRIVWSIGISPAVQRLRIEANETDMSGQGGFAPPQAGDLADKYGINRGRFFVRSSLAIWYFALNTERPLFRDNPNLRKAVNHAMDRRYLGAQDGYLAGARTDQILPSAMPGFRDANIYSLRGPNLPLAQRLARGNTRGGKAIYYGFTTGLGPGVAQALEFSLRQIGIDLEIKLFDPNVVHAKAGTRGEPFDIVQTGWAADYPDPSNFLNLLLGGRALGKEHNLNMSYFDDSSYNRELERASRLFGTARLRAYGQLDVDVMREAAPLAPFLIRNARMFVSEDVGCFVFSSATRSPNLVAVCKK
jgi:ABC-type transport system substrate-binding protein